jgi:hypothetical protein
LPTLSVGARGPAVELLQRLLTETAHEGEPVAIAIDGVFGKQTELRVAMHQTDAGLDPSGVCDSVTWQSLCWEEFWGIDRIGRKLPDDVPLEVEAPPSLSDVDLSEFESVNLPSTVPEPRRAMPPPARTTERPPLTDAFELRPAKQPQPP